MSNEDAAFFDQMETIGEPYRRLADCIHERIPEACDVLDVGAGVAFVPERLAELGHASEGWDCKEACDRALKRVIGRPPKATFDMLAVDLREPMRTRKRACVICTETAEHLEAEHADNLVEIVTTPDPQILIWSAAGPGQDWPGHVNMQPAEYWLTKLAARGYEPDMVATQKLRDRMVETNAQHVGGRHTFFVMVRRAS